MLLLFLLQPYISPFYHYNTCKKNFVVFPKKGRNSRIENLLQVCNLKNRIYNPDINIDNEIDYNNTYLSLENDRKESISFLKQALDLEKN